MTKPEHENEQSDAIWLARLKRGDADAFDVLFERHRRGLLAYANGILRDRGLAEDVVQEAFLALVRNLHRMRPGKGVSGWLYRVTRNRAYDLLRRRRRERAALDREVKEATSAPAQPAKELVEAERDAALARVLQTLSVQDRELVLLRFYSGLKFREIARLVRRPMGTVLWRMRCILSEMAGRLEGWRDEENL